ncbi:uncharacterized protein THITE_115510 [Thermothielavioides terrestris NRRL 8126]|uniref:Uncharacterized protein n=1 Tax=Thermothielavioides terrestris (strain ATCC 38088 / NRRL 8126) TaxID=578455 RepID=G2QVR3_THETT|nr:uncharacterized protein THITE_115510 [Thermothielavioides terrestris NRRL 8126]AEO63844.1 hypothetical protein THITE_115510 [Thermothielavioides terrestris NRRL 8126]
MFLHRQYIAKIAKVFTLSPRPWRDLFNDDPNGANKAAAYAPKKINERKACRSKIQESESPKLAVSNSAMTRQSSTARPSPAEQQSSLPPPRGPLSADCPSNFACTFGCESSKCTARSSWGGKSARTQIPQSIMLNRKVNSKR